MSVCKPADVLQCDLVSHTAADWSLSFQQWKLEWRWSSILELLVGSWRCGTGGGWILFNVSNVGPQTDRQFSKTDWRSAFFCSHHVKIVYGVEWIFSRFNWRYLGQMSCHVCLFFGLFGIYKSILLLLQNPSKLGIPIEKI